MKANVGTIDKVVRIVLGLGLISIVFVGPHTPWGWIGIVPLATALMGWCPLYSVIGMDTLQGEAKGEVTDEGGES